MDEPGGLHLKRRLRCGLGGRLLEWHSSTLSREEREKRAVPERRDPKFGVSTFRKPRTLARPAYSRAARTPIDQ